MRLPFLALLLFGLAACAGSGASTDNPDETFGTRVDSGDRETMLLEPAEAEAAYHYYAAPFDTLQVRVASGPAPVPVEVLVKGSLPDACTDLHEVRQDRDGNLVNVELEMRRPKKTLCAQVTRPYRFYLSLDGAFEAGNYTLKVNGEAQPFEVRSRLASRQ